MNSGSPAPASSELFEYHAPTPIWAGLGSRQHVAAAASALGLSRVLLVASRRVLESSSGGEVVERLGNRRIATYDGLGGEPDVADARRLANYAKTVHADGVLVVGSGATLGLAKCAVVDLASDGSLEDFQWSFDPASSMPQGPPLPSSLLPIIALPTTAGSGSEVNGFGSVRHSDRGHKVAVRGAGLAPRVAILDGELTTSASPRLTAGTGLNALSHCVESLYSKQAQPFSDGLALEAARRMAWSLPRCVRDGSDLEARQEQLVASAMSSMAFANAMLGVHAALCHALAIATDVVYGDAQSVIFGRALAFRSEVIEPATAQICEVMGLGGPGSPHERLAEWADNLGGPTRLRDIGVDRTQLASLASVAFNDRCVAADPRPVRDQGDLLDILEQAW